MRIPPKLAMPVASPGDVALAWLSKIAMTLSMGATPPVQLPGVAQFVSAPPLVQRRPTIERWRGLMAELRAGGEVDYAAYVVLMRELEELAS